MCFMLVHMSVPHLDVCEHRNIAIYSVFIICLPIIYLPMLVPLLLDQKYMYFFQDSHMYYNSSFYPEVSGTWKEYWLDLKKDPESHTVLPGAHRKTAVRSSPLILYIYFLFIMFHILFLLSYLFDNHAADSMLKQWWLLWWQ